MMIACHSFSKRLHLNTGQATSIQQPLCGPEEKYSKDTPTDGINSGVLHLCNQLKLQQLLLPSHLEEKHFVTLSHALV
jgi:hypothetical protein